MYCRELEVERYRKTRVGERLVRSFSHQTRDRKELATKQFVLPELEISESTKVFLGSFSKKNFLGVLFENSTKIDNLGKFLCNAL